MKEKPENTIPLVDDMEQFVKTNVELYSLRATGIITRVVSSLLTSLVIWALGFIVLFMLGMGLALWIGHLIGNMYSGFLILAAAFTLIAIIAYYNRYTMIRKPLMNGMIEQILKDKHHD
jgi:uncharacterized membrane protein YccC